VLNRERHITLENISRAWRVQSATNIVRWPNS